MALPAFNRPEYVYLVSAIAWKKCGVKKASRSFLVLNYVVDTAGDEVPFWLIPTTVLYYCFSKLTGHLIVGSQLSFIYDQPSRDCFILFFIFCSHAEYANIIVNFSVRAEIAPEYLKNSAEAALMKSSKRRSYCW